MKVENKNAHRAADKEYYFATYVKSDAGPGDDDVIQLLLTDKELERAAKRAEKNKEDLQLCPIKKIRYLVKILLDSQD